MSLADWLHRLLCVSGGEVSVHETWWLYDHYPDDTQSVPLAACPHLPAGAEGWIKAREGSWDEPCFYLESNVTDGCTVVCDSVCGGVDVHQVLAEVSGWGSSFRARGRREKRLGCGRSGKDRFAFKLVFYWFSSESSHTSTHQSAATQSESSLLPWCLEQFFGWADTHLM